jgi:hypothetical protein
VPVKKSKKIEIRWVNKVEFHSMVDTKAKRVLGISAKQFVTRWKAGKYRKLDADTCPGVVELALLASIPRKKRAGKVPKRGGAKLH